VQAAVAAVTPLSAESTNTQQILASGAPDGVASQGAPAAHQSATPVQVASPPTAIVNPHQSARQGGFDHGTDGEGRQSAANQTASTSASTSTENGPATDQALAASAAAAATSATSGPTAPAHIRPTEVVNQIAHQAELYRLPGNRGVRIQLHPEDLGGVDVTLRYSNTGGIQLHINVEHASTGALVQSGWTELRDALATQGISPDRLVLSISGPSDAGHLDFSSGNGSRPDPGLSFQQGNQDQAGQQGQRGQEAHLNNQGWNGGPEPPLSTDELPRSAATAASSRIDYRV
jgi:flagellar hook-length control protein FliK